MKTHLSIVSAAMGAVISAGCLSGPAVANDPELFKNESKNVSRYAGVMPEKVRTIAFISPGSTPHELHRKGIELLRQAGYNIKVMPHAFSRQKDINQPPLDGKLSDFYAAWNDPEVDMILCVRGGMGTETLLDHLDWGKLKKRPELYVQGYSDATLLVCALLTKGNGHPIAGSMSGSLPGLTDDSIEAMKKVNHGETLGPIPVRTLIPGDCQGFPVGGSLYKLSRIAVKDYCPDMTGKIIFIEGAKIKPEQIREKLYGLLENKFFAKASGVVFCQFTGGGSKSEVDKVLLEIAPKLGVPVYADYPFGHVPRNYSIDFLRPLEIRSGKVTFPAVRK